MQLSGYTIDTEIGRGGMATVFKGTQTSLQRPVAIKVLNHSLHDTPEIRDRFERESKIIARLNHPNIVHVVDQGVTDQGTPYFIMEYVKSVNLKQAMQSNRLEVARALDIFAQIAKGLAYAHKNRVIHCDIKPENVLVDFEGVVRIVDFGIARVFASQNKASVGTVSEEPSQGQGAKSSGLEGGLGGGLEGSANMGEMGSDEHFVLGSPNYMAPEQSQSLAHATEKSDIYSLGVIMYFYFCHSLPIEGAPPLSKINPKVPQSLSDLVAHCIATDPQRRPQSAEWVHTQILRVLSGRHIGETQKKRANADVKAAFNLLDVIREGEFSSVYLYEKSTLEHSALFVIKKKPLQSAGHVQAQKLAKIDHPNIVSVLGTSSNARTFVVVMAYCSGGSLADTLIRTYSIPEFLRVASGIAVGLAFAHQQGVVHGNLRPTNILFDENGLPKLTDFGQDEHYQTRSGNWYSLVGEPLSKAADQYSLGVIFYQMLTGKLPKWKNNKLVACAPFKKIPKELQQCITTLLSAAPEHRFGSMNSVVTFLHSQLEDENTVARPVAGQVTHVRYGRYVWVGVIITVMAVTALASLAGFIFL